MNAKRNSARCTGTHGLHFLGAVITAIGLAMAAPVQALPVNLVVNGGFETGDFTGWTQIGNTGFSGVQCPGPGFAPQGSCDAFFGPVGSVGGISQVITGLHVGQLYLLTFALGPDGGTPSSFSASLGGSTLVSLTNLAASGFRNFSFALLATAANETLAFNFRDDPGFLLFDAVSLSVPEPASVGLLGMALIAMFMGLRRKVQ